MFYLKIDLDLSRHCQALYNYSDASENSPFRHFHLHALIAKLTPLFHYLIEPIQTQYFNAPLAALRLLLNRKK